jgi:hypothetical protein
MPVSVSFETAKLVDYAWIFVARPKSDMICLMSGYSSPSATMLRISRIYKYYSPCH